MFTNDPSRPRAKRFRSIAAWLLCGATIGLLVGMSIVPADLYGRDIVLCIFAVGGGLWAAAAVTGILGRTGWMMIAGAILGGVVAILANGHGKSAIYGTPIGVGVGLVAGLMIENHRRQRRTDQ